MRVLLDESVPRQLRRFLRGHEARTVQEMGWSGKSNGELLALAGPVFDVFLAVDQNIEYQQNLRLADIPILVLDQETVRGMQLFAREVYPRLKEQASLAAL
ncbi:MAG: DUF5615 family PIN-like protein [Desulfurellaceae bacterium]|nr:DUF5615 family PIN-like protein [Desulfurellaceae bacterium]